ncbi:MAG: methyltransferase domain-containing protein [Muribaculum sp.]|nr:methyltransferase domain-containing protein [Muribaculum sp.]
MWDNIKERIENGDYASARTLLEKEKSLRREALDDTFAILDASVYEEAADREGMFDAIASGLRFNPFNYELYYMLGSYYMDSNPYQAFLCFENAEFYCDRKDDLDIIRQEKYRLADLGFSVPPLSIIILSYNARKQMSLCLDSIRQYGGSCGSFEVIVIDNASTDGVVEYLRSQKDIRLFCNTENVGFPAGCNQGIKMADPYNDIFLLNNDTIIAPNSVFWLRMGLYERDSVGGTGSVTNFASNGQTIEEVFETTEAYLNYAAAHNIPMHNPYEKKLCLTGFAFMIKRTALDNVGLLDERFSPGNYEDDDLSYRLLQVGYQLLLCRNSFIYHFGSLGFAKNRTQYRDLLQTNAAKFKDKWGIDYSYYKHERQDITDYIEDDRSSSLHILEIGCGLGATLGYLQNKYPNAEVYGIELEGQIARIAQKYIPTIRQGNIEAMTLEYPEHFFDYIIFGDVLEHLHDPQKVLAGMHHYLKPSGAILASIPNVLYYTVILGLLQGNFRYEDAGILDGTHLRFFTYKEIVRLFAAAGFTLQSAQQKQVMSDMTAEDKEMFDALLKLPHIVAEDDFLTYQYLVKAVPAE